MEQRQGGTLRHLTQLHPLGTCLLYLEGSMAVAQNEISTRKVSLTFRS